jgi:voltage-gated potassium channel
MGGALIRKILKEMAHNTSMKSRMYDELYCPLRRGGLSSTNAFFAAFIVFGVVVVVLETEPTLFDQYRRQFSSIDFLLALVFTAEYVLRLYVVGEDDRFRGIIGRIRYVLTPMAMIDLLSITPFYTAVLSNDLFLLRMARLLRMFSLLKVGRYSRAVTEFIDVLTRRRAELVLSLAIVLFVLLVSSSVMYLVEGPEQPDAFGSIPRALWWGIVTLTTVGYGDVYPRTVIGKIFCAITALAGIGLIAMPTAILAAAFGEVFTRMNNKSDYAAADIAQDTADKSS